MIYANFNKTLEGLNGLQVGVFLIDNQYLEGTLLDVQHDYLIIEVQQKDYYFPIDQIKALQKNAKVSTLLLSSSQKVSRVEKPLFDDVLEDLRLHWVTINSFSSLRFEGVLSTILDDFILLSEGEKQFFVPKSTISNIFDGPFEIEEKQSEDNESQDESKTENTNQENDDQAEINQNDGNQDAASSELDQLSSTEDSNSGLQESSELENPNDDSPPSDESSLEPENPIITAIKESRVKLANYRSKNTLPDANISTLQKSLLMGAISMSQEFVEAAAKTKTAKNADFMNIFNCKDPVAPLNGWHSKKKNKKPITDEETEKKRDSVSTKEIISDNHSSKAPKRKIRLEEERQLLQNQYYSLMKQAEKMSHLEPQYSALMNHAKKMYEQIKK